MSGNKRKGREGVPPPVPSKKQSKKESTTSIPSLAVVSEEKTSTESSVGDSGSIDEHPLQNGHYLIVKYRDGSNRLAKIIECTSGSSPRSLQYYIHYSDFNRRMDEWISSTRIVAYPSEANVIGANREAQENLAKKLKSSDSKGSLTEAELKASQDVKTSSSTPLAVAPIASRSTGGNIHRSGRSRSNSMVNLQPQMAISTVADMDHDEHEGMDEESLLEHEEVTKIKNIKYVKLGKYIMECWYFSPFPPEYYPNGFAECLFFCEFSFRFFSTKEELIRYQKKPNLARHPPGNEIYRDAEVSMFELDGAVEKVYCQNLCYFAKLFLDHKTLYWDVDPFLFYVLCTRDERGFHPVGYFSKEKYSDMGYNLACILTFPCLQRNGYGRFLMAFSYELSKKEEKAGSPEKPLSDLGAVGYKSYWAHTILKVLRDYPGQIISVMDITKITSILPDDVQATLQMLNLIHYYNTTGTSNTGAGRVSPTAEGDQSSEHCVLYAPEDVIDSLLVKYPEGKLPVQPEKLHWAPLYVTDPKKDKWSIKSLGNAKESSASGASSKVETAPDAIVI